MAKKSKLITEAHLTKKQILQKVHSRISLSMNDLEPRKILREEKLKQNIWQRLRACFPCLLEKG